MAGCANPSVRSQALENEFDKSIEPVVDKVVNWPLGSGVVKGVGILKCIRLTDQP